MNWKCSFFGALISSASVLIVVNASVRIIEGSEKIFPAYEKFTLTCKGVGTLQWKSAVADTDRLKEILQNDSTILEVENPNVFDTGYYKCYDASYPDINDEIYVYVFDNVHLFVPSADTIITAKVRDEFTLPCIATHPNISVTLHKDYVHTDRPYIYNPREGLSIKHLAENYTGYFMCYGRYGNLKEYENFLVDVKDVEDNFLTEPRIPGINVIYSEEGEDLTLSCTVIVKRPEGYSFNWNLPGGKEMNQTDRIQTSRHTDPKYIGSYNSFREDIINLTINSVRLSDEGNYSCFIKTATEYKKDTVQLKVIGENHGSINFTIDNGSTHTEVDNRALLKWAVGYMAYSTPTFQWIAPNGTEIESNSKYQIITNSTQTVLVISSVTSRDAGTYLLIGKSDRKGKILKFTLSVKEPLLSWDFNSLQRIHILEGPEKIFPAFLKFNLTCTGPGSLQWRTPVTGTDRVREVTENESRILEVDNPTILDSGSYECYDTNKPHNMDEINVYIFDPEKNFLSMPYIIGNDVIHSEEGEDIELSCTIIVRRLEGYAFNWILPQGIEMNQTDRIQTSRYTDPKYIDSYNSFRKDIINLTINSVRLSDEGNYSCFIKGDTEYKKDTVQLEVIGKNNGFINFIIDGNMTYTEVDEDDPVYWTVKYEANSTPTFQWIAPNGNEIESNSKYQITTSSTQIVLAISSIKQNDAGTYLLIGKTDRKGKILKFILSVKDSSVGWFVRNWQTILIMEGSEKIFPASIKFTLTCFGLGSLNWRTPGTGTDRLRQVTENEARILEVDDPSILDTGYYTCYDEHNPDKMAEIYVYVFDNMHLFLPTSENIVKAKSLDEYILPCITSHPNISVTLQEFPELGQIKVAPYDPRKGFVLNNIPTSGDGHLACVGKYGNLRENAYYLFYWQEPGLFLCGWDNVPVGTPMNMWCRTSNHNYAHNYTFWWRPKNGSNFEQLQYHEGLYTIGKGTYHSFESHLIFNATSREQSGVYQCRTTMLGTNNVIKSNELNLKIYKRVLTDFKVDHNESQKIYEGDGIILDCRLDTTYPPHILWFKDGLDLSSRRNQSLLHDNEYILVIPQSEMHDAGLYECFYITSSVNISRSFNVSVIRRKELSNSKGIEATVSVILIVLIIAAAYLSWRIRKQRKIMLALTAQDVATFYEGTILTADPDLDIQEQADLLPYNKNFEFPREKLILGHQIGSGAYGRVVKAEAKGIKEGEEFTTVAVKMIKPHADVSHLKALMTELKILMYIGHHLNVLNLLGACTRKLMHKELLVIMEYCQYGNLHSYLFRHRGSFINQINPSTDVIDFSIGRGAVLGTSEEKILKNPSDDSSNCSKVMSNDSGGDSKPTLEESKAGNSNDLGWNITYNCDFNSKIKSPLSTKDLLSWAYQVATGMEYLSSLKIVHADIAARNILLADDDVVKICDFGLARNMYANMDYKKKGQDPLPFKWMAPESIEDRIFSTKSDVWSFGVLLWELFTLGKTPYPGMHANEDFLKQLLDGYRMFKPEYSTNDIYRIMLDCWKSNTWDRPDFSELKLRTGQLLSKEIKQHYVELNRPYANQNGRIMKMGNHYVDVTHGRKDEYMELKSPVPVYENIRAGGFVKLQQSDGNPEDPESDEGDNLPMNK